MKRPTLLPAAAVSVSTLVTRCNADEDDSVIEFDDFTVERQ